MTPYYSDDHVTLYHARWEDVPPDLLRADVLVTDPPYGVAWQTDPEGSRSRLRAAGVGGFEPIEGDDGPFDPAPLLALGLPTVMFGANHFASRLPDSPTWLVWDKRGRNGFVNDQSDAEMAWTNIGGPLRVFRHVWNGGGNLARENQTSTSAGRATGRHPTQKPLALMLWVLSHPRLPTGTVLDPYAGSGTTLVAAKALGRRAIGVECVERYCESTAIRLRQEALWTNETAG